MSMKMQGDISTLRRKFNELQESYFDLKAEVFKLQADVVRLMDAQASKPPEKPKRGRPKKDAGTTEGAKISIGTGGY